MADTDVLSIEAAGGVDRVMLNRPDRLNALNQPLTDALFAYFESKRRDAQTRVILDPRRGPRILFRQQT